MPTRVIVNTDTIMYIYDTTGNKWAEKKLTNTQKAVRYYMNIFEYNHTTVGPHVHLQMKFNGTPVNPTPYFNF